MSLLKNVINQTLNKVVSDHSEDIVPIFTELFNIISGNLVRNNFTLREMMEWFGSKNEEFPDAAAGAAILKKSGKTSIITFCLLTKEGTPYIYEDEFIGQEITCNDLDKEIRNLFGSKNIIFFN